MNRRARDLPASQFRHQLHAPRRASAPGYDIGLLRLAEPIDGVEYAVLPTAQEADDLLQESDELNVLLVGYGLTDSRKRRVWRQDPGRCVSARGRRCRNPHRWQRKRSAELQR